jgi:hypothetical protein
MEIMKPVMENEDVLDAFKSYCDDLRYGMVSLDECSEKMMDVILAALNED